MFVDSDFRKPASSVGTAQNYAVPTEFEILFDSEFYKHFAPTKLFSVFQTNACRNISLFAKNTRRTGKNKNPADFYHTGFLGCFKLEFVWIT